VARTEESTGTLVQSWVPLNLAAELNRHADADRRSVSSTIRLAIEDKMRADEERRPAHTAFQ